MARFKSEIKKPPSETLFVPFMDAKGQLHHAQTILGVPVSPVSPVSPANWYMIIKIWREHTFSYIIDIMLLS